MISIDWLLRGQFQTNGLSLTIDLLCSIQIYEIPPFNVCEYLTTIILPVFGPGERISPN